MLKKAEKPENAQPAAKRKLTRAERKQIGAIIRQAKGDGKPHTVQDSIPFWNLYPDGLCRLDDRLFSKTIAYEDVNYRLAGPDDQRDIFERLCDFYNGYDPSIGVQMTLSSRHEDKTETCSAWTPRATRWMICAWRRPASCKYSMSAATTAL